MTIINLRQDATDLRQYLAERVQQQVASKPTEIIHMIQVGFYFTQSGHITVYFSPEPESYSDGRWTLHIKDQSLFRPTWHEASSLANANLGQPVTLIQLDGSETNLAAEISWEEASKIMLISTGEMIKYVLTYTRDEGLFATLAKGPSCLFNLEEFDGGYFWPTGDYKGTDHLL